MKVSTLKTDVNSLHEERKSRIESYEKCREIVTRLEVLRQELDEFAFQELDWFAGYSLLAPIREIDSYIDDKIKSLLFAAYQDRTIEM